MLLCSRLMAYRAFHCKICGIPRWHTYLGRSQESIDLSLVASSWHDHRRYLTLVGKVGKSPESKPFSRNIFSASSINGHLTQTSQVGTCQKFSRVAQVLRQSKWPTWVGRYLSGVFPCGLRTKVGKVAILGGQVCRYLSEVFPCAGTRLRVHCRPEGQNRLPLPRQKSVSSEQSIPRS